MSDVPPQPQPQPSGENFLTRKYGPLPAWGWLVGTIVVVYIFLRMRSSGQQQATGTTGTTTAGAPNALTSNLVGVAQPTPTLDGTYQVTVSPSNAPSPVYAQTGSSSTQGMPSGSSPPSGSLTGTSTTSTNANQTTQVQPQTQPSSPQTQQSTTMG